MGVSEFLDDYWWAVFLILIFMASVVFKPAPRRRGPGVLKSGAHGGADGGGYDGADTGGGRDNGGDGGDGGGD